MKTPQEWMDEYNAITREDINAIQNPPSETQQKEIYTRIREEKKMEEQRDEWFRKLYSNTAPKEWIEERLKEMKARTPVPTSSLLGQKTAEQIREDYANNRQKIMEEYANKWDRPQGKVLRQSDPNRIEKDTPAAAMWKKEKELKEIEDQIRGLERRINTVESDEWTELLQLKHKHKELLKSMANEKFGESEKKTEELQKEYDRAFTQGFTSEQLKQNLDRAIKGDFQDDWQKELEERKKEYNASGRGIDFNKPRTDEEEDERMQYPPEYYKSVNYFRDADMKIPPKQSDIAYTDISFGADIEAEQAFQQELHGIVDDMKVKLVDEKKILEGTLNPEYGKGEWGLPNIARTYATAEEMVKHETEKVYVAYNERNEGYSCIPRGLPPKSENELSNSKPTEEQWKNDSQNGSLITDLTPTSTHDSSSSSSTAEDSNPSFPTVSLRRQSTRSLTASCSGKSDDCGIETDAMNESSECTVPMISAAMLGTLSEVRWSPPLRSMESSVPNLLDARS